MNDNNEILDVNINQDTNVMNQGVNNTNFDNNINNQNPKKSKKGLVVIIILLLIIAGLCTFIYLKKDVLFNNGNNNNNTNENNNANTNENNNQQQNDNKKKELSSDNKKKILDIIGLTENGYKRENINEVKDPDPSFVDMVKDTEYIDYSVLDTAPYLIDLDAGNHTVNDLERESFEQFITVVSKNVDIVNVFDDKNDPCYEMAGVCKKISKSQFEEIAKIYNINSSKSSVLKKYNGYYVVPYIGTFANLLKISDNLVFSYDKDDVLVTYDIHLTNFPGVDPFELNKKIEYRFKTYDDGSYYLNNFVITNL